MSDRENCPRKDLKVAYIGKESTAVYADTHGVSALEFMEREHEATKALLRRVDALQRELAKLLRTGQP